MQGFSGSQNAAAADTSINSLSLVNNSKKGSTAFGPPGAPEMD